MKGIKNDANKPRWDLLPWGEVAEVVQIFTYGASRYGDYNWQNGIDVSRLYAAALRHLVAWWLGEDLDQESGRHHLAHACAELLMAMWMSTHLPQHDNRRKHELVLCETEIDC